MNPADFPDLPKWIAVLAERDKGIMLIGMIALSAAIWLVMTRFTYPRLLPLVRVGLLLGFYALLVIPILMGVV